MIFYDGVRDVSIRAPEEILYSYADNAKLIASLAEAYGFKDKLDENGNPIPLLRTRTHKREEEVVRFDGPTVDPVSVFNAHPDPYYPRINEMRYFAIRRWADRASLKLEDENHYRLTGKPKFKNLDKIPTVKTGYIESIYQMDYGDDMAEAMGWTNETARE